MVDFNNSGFTEDQTSYLSGFVSGLLQVRDLPFLGQDPAGRFTHETSVAAAPTVFGTPIDDLCKEERVKYEQHGLDCYDTIFANAETNAFPEDGDIFRYKFHGLFFVTPAQESLMLRCRIAGGALSTRQFRGLAEIAADWGPGHTDLTTRANLQVREIMPKDCPAILMKLADLGLTSQGSGADNVRNITATATTGFDPTELLDVMPYARSIHHYILKNRDLYGLPRKFNISYDSGGKISTCTDTNDIGFYAVHVSESQISNFKSQIPNPPAPGIYFRMQLCGITGHKQFASDCGVLLTPAETIPVAAALMRVFIENGDRTNRKKARLKYLVDDWGIQKLLDETTRKLAFPLRYFPLENCEPSLPKEKHAHLGIHPQTDGKNYIGILTPVGRMSCQQMHQIAAIADTFGRGEIRLTVWQNLIIPGIPDEMLEAATAAILATGFDYRPAAITGGIIACTGSRGCKYAAADTKGNAVALGKHLDQSLKLDTPINIHLTGCNHSCAQHYIGDIGMMGVKVKTATGETVEGYNIVLGGGVDDTQAVAKEVWKNIPFTDVPPLMEKLLIAYLANRSSAGESFAQFTNRHTPDAIQTLVSAN